jgi:hypothetical protein
MKWALSLNYIRKLTQAWAWRHGLIFKVKTIEFFISFIVDN